MRKNPDREHPGRGEDSVLDQFFIILGSHRHDDARDGRPEAWSDFFEQQGA
jgi:hypothetical protein